jgi:predicted RND superfamily exporter protein
MSLFSVVGIIGMSGIIVNDSIVLVSTIDEYAQRQPMRRAIVNAVSTRLRPVFLTTLTTLIGLAPLLYDTSAQSAFLKPTVVTLVYGLGIGMFLVLLVVPAIAAVVEDASGPVRSFRRALSGAPRRMRQGFWMAVVALLALAALCFGPLTLGLPVPAGVAALVPGAAGGAVLPWLLVYLVVIAVVFCGAGVAYAIALRRRAAGDLDRAAL